MVLGSYCAASLSEGQLRLFGSLRTGITVRLEINN